MLDYLPSNPDVIAIRCGGQLRRHELETYVDRLDQALEAREQTHLYAEIVDFRGFDLEGFGDLMKRSVGFFRQLRKIGRVAIVADQSWIRWAAKLESALLPHIAYETFELRDRERAFAWAQGEIDRPHGPALRIIETDRPEVLAFEIDGAVGEAEMERATTYFLEAVRRHDRVRVLGRIRSLGGIEMSGLMRADYFTMKREFLERMERYAVVGGPGWLRTAVLALAPLFKVDIRHFEADEEAEAWSWLDARPVSEHALVP